MGRKARKTERRKIETEFLKEKFVGRSAQPGCHDFVIVLDNLKPNFNLGKIFRSAYGFGARAVHVVGTRWFDPGPAKGALKYVPAKFFDSIEESFTELAREGYKIFVFDLGGTEELDRMELPRKSAFVLGNEGLGITFDCAGKDVTIVSIPQFGRLESLNVSVAASIAMYEYVRQHRGKAGGKSG